MRNNALPSQKVMLISLYTTVFLLTFEMAATFSFYLLEVSLSVLSLSFLVTLLCEEGVSPVGWMTVLVGRASSFLPIVFSALVYLAVDLITNLYSPSLGVALPKYKVVLVMLLVTAVILYNCKGIEELIGLQVTFAAAGVFISVITIINYLFPVIYPVYYTLRLTLRTDYNMFATTVYTTMVAGVYLAINSKLSIWKKMACVIFLFSTELTVIFLSGSRRIYIAILPTVGVTVAVFIIKEIKMRGRRLQTALASICMAVGISLLTLGSVQIMYRQMLYTYREQGVTGARGMLGKAETKVSQRYETLADSSIWSKRTVIWGIAVDEIAGYSPIELTVGKGNGYNILLYDREGDRLQGIYPDVEKRTGALSAHNILLADLLDGGIMKLLALILLLSVLGCYLAIFLIMDYTAAMPYLFIIGCAVMGSMISNRYGLLYDKFFYIFATMMGLEIRSIREKNDGQQHETNLYDYQRTPK